MDRQVFVHGHTRAKMVGTGAECWEAPLACEFCRQCLSNLLRLFALSCRLAMVLPGQCVFKNSADPSDYRLYCGKIPSYFVLVKI